MKWKEVIKYTATEWSGKWSIDNSVGSDLGTWIQKFKDDAAGKEPRTFYERSQDPAPSEEKVKANRKQFDIFVDNMTKAYEELDKFMSD